MKQNSAFDKLWRSCWVVVAGTLAVTAVAVEPDAEGWIAFDGSEGRITLHGSVRGEPARIVLDSGSDVGAVAAAFAERAGIESDGWTEYSAIGVVSDTRVSAARSFELELGNSTVPLRGLPIVPSAFPTPNFDLLLGRQVFEAAVVQIDYPNAAIRFLSFDAVGFEGNVNARRDASGRLLVETIIEGHRAWLMLDTGNSGPTMLTRRFVSRHGLEAAEVESAHFHGADVATSAQTRVLQFERASMGPYQFEALLAHYNPEGDSALDGRRRTTGSRIQRAQVRHDGLLGHEVLQNFLVTADFRRGKLHLHLP